MSETEEHATPSRPRRRGTLSSTLFAAGVFSVGLAALIWVVGETGLIDKIPAGKRTTEEQKNAEFKSWWDGRTEGYDSGKQEVLGWELIQLGDMRRDQFLLNRANGRVWKSICDTSGVSAAELKNARVGDCPGQEYFVEVFVHEGGTPKDSFAGRAFQRWMDELMEKQSD